MLFFLYETAGSGKQPVHFHSACLVPILSVLSPVTGMLVPVESRRAETGRRPVHG